VQQVNNRMDLKTSTTTVGNKVDDAIVTARVKSTLLADALIKGLDITVVTRKGEVQLSGFVDNPDQMNRAAALAREVEGVASVNNQMSLKK
jgi:hyperosmotically inducible protein